MRLSVFLILLFNFIHAQEVDLVHLGKETFHNLGCAECHSEIKNDDSVKTGPGVYGLFQKEARDRNVLAGGEQHQQTIKADWQYFLQSIRKPNEDISIAEHGDNKGEAYLPVMPPYPETILSEFKAKAIFHYLQTLNNESLRGPANVIVNNPEQASKYDPLTDPFEILVTDKTRIYRTRIENQSARAVYVGTPSGINYAFDPVSLSIERIWFGGFINIKGSLDGRGQKPSKLGHLAQELDLQAHLLAPINPTTGKPVDLSFKSPRMRDYKTIGSVLNSDQDFADQLANANAKFLGYTHSESPSFQYQVGKNTITLQFTVNQIGEAKLSLSGTLVEPQTFQLSPIINGKTEWTIDSLPAELNFSIPVKPSWRPSAAKPATQQQSVEISPAKSVRLPANYTAKQIAAPTDPHGRPQLFEPLGMTNGIDGSLIVATRTAGVWTLKDGQWTQVAEGLQDCLGVVQEPNGSLVVGQKPELTRLTDTNSDGWYDHYETLSEAFLATSNYHEYVHGPAKGSDGNYYILLNLTHHNIKEAIYKAGGKFMGTQGGYRGWALQVTPTGETTPFANGLRSPAGLATGPDGNLYYTENQGEYVGTSKLFKLEKNKFYGHPSGLVDLPGMKPNSEEIQWPKVEATKAKALALTPHSRIANAPGSPTWLYNDSSDLLLGDQTLSTLFKIRLQEQEHEAALIPFADQFPSGLMRLTSTADKKLYIGQTGRGWRAKGGSQDALVTIERNDTEAPNQLVNIVRSNDSFTLHFSKSIDKEIANDQLVLETWTYLDSPNYGSKENDKAQLTIKTIEITPKSKTVTIQLDSIPNDNKNRVYSFISKDLPKTKGDSFEAYYSIVKK